MPAEPQLCSLCGQIEGDANNNALAPILGSDWSQRPLLAESRHAVAMPSIGALTRGHLLVCPKLHLRSLAVADPEQGADLNRLANAVEEQLGRECGEPVHMFEHGSSTAGERVACSIEHAHLHLVPAAVDVRASLRRLADWQSVSEYSPDLHRQTGGAEYLLYAAPTGERWVATTDLGFPSQLIRRVFAEALGLGEEWDWRAHPAREKMLATVEIFAGASGARLVGASC